MATLSASSLYMWHESGKLLYNLRCMCVSKQSIVTVYNPITVTQTVVLWIVVQPESQISSTLEASKLILHLKLKSYTPHNLVISNALKAKSIAT